VAALGDFVEGVANLRGRCAGGEEALAGGGGHVVARDEA
jgi:hypothetical protein